MEKHKEEYYKYMLIKCYDIMIRHEKMFYTLAISLFSSIILNIYFILNQ